jgi:glutamine synthetase
LPPSADKLAREVLGDHVLSRFIEAKTAEWDEYRTRVTQWELDSYLTRY